MTNSAINLSFSTLVIVFSVNQKHALFFSVLHVLVAWHSGNPFVESTKLLYTWQLNRCMKPAS